MKRHLVDVGISLPYEDTRFDYDASFNLCLRRTPSRNLHIDYILHSKHLFKV